METAVTSADCQIGFCCSAIFQHVISSQCSICLSVKASPHHTAHIVCFWLQICAEALFNVFVWLFFFFFCLVQLIFKEGCRLMRVWLMSENKRVTSFLVFVSLWGEFTESARLSKFSCLIAPCDVNKRPPKQMLKTNLEITRGLRKRIKLSGFCFLSCSTCLERNLFFKWEGAVAQSFCLFLFHRYCSIRPRDQSRRSFKPLSKSEY